MRFWSKAWSLSAFPYILQLPCIQIFHSDEQTTRCTRISVWGEDITWCLKSSFNINDRFSHILDKHIFFPFKLDIWSKMVSVSKHETYSFIDIQLIFRVQIYEYIEHESFLPLDFLKIRLYCRFYREHHWAPYPIRPALF